MDGKITCFCCGYKTLTEGPGEYNICPVCFWENDGSGVINSNEPSSANNMIRLSDAQKNYLEYGVYSPDFINKVRKHLSGEIKDKDWKPFK